MGPGISKIPSGGPDAIADIMNGKFPGVPKFYFPTVDVRDVAHAHILALSKPSINRERIMIVEKVYKFVELTGFLAEEFKSRGCKVTNKELPKCPMTIYGLFNKDVGNMMSQWNVKYQINHKKSQELLGLEYTPIQ